MCLDEADEMLKLGFQKDVEKIISFIKSNSNHTIQLLMFSATLPDWVISLARKYMRSDFTYVDLLKGKGLKTPSTIQHLCINALKNNPHDLNRMIRDIINAYIGPQGSVIIFC